MAIIKILRKRLNLSLMKVYEKTGIPKNRQILIEKNLADPKPDEIVQYDKVLKQNRRLVLTYCSTVCPAGKYAGYQFNDMDIQTAGIKLISTLTTMDRLLPELADMLCEGRLTQEVVAKLSQLRLSITALEVQLSRDKACSSADVTSIREFAEREKKKATLSRVAT